MTDKIKGYVVRGKDEYGATVAASGIGGTIGPYPDRQTIFETGSAAAGAYYALTCYGCTDVHIYAVHADGTETPVPSYERALAEIRAIDAALTAAIGGAKDREPDEKVAALGARVAYWLNAWEQMKASRDAERAGWVKFSLAAIRFHEGDTAEAEVDRDAAMRDLSAIGVDVGALLEAEVNAILARRGD